MNKNSINLKEGENAVKTAKKGSSLNNYLMTAVL
jgi:hypothetical protein